MDGGTRPRGSRNGWGGGVGAWWWGKERCLAGGVGEVWWESKGLWWAERERGAGAERVGGRRARSRGRRVVRMVAWLLMERFGVEQKACLVFVEMSV